MEYFDTYFHRVNKYGDNYRERILSKRIKEFNNYYLEKSIYRVDFVYEEETYPGTFEIYRQDQSKSLKKLLTKRELSLPVGAILQIPNEQGINKPWMVYWLEDNLGTGYNTYVLLKMTHYLIWEDQTGENRNSWAYFYGQEDNMLKDEIKSRSRMSTLYVENLKMSFFIMPINQYIKKDIYLEVGIGELKQAYNIVGYDIQSTLGAEYVTVDPVYIRDKSEVPIQTAEDTSESTFWLNRGDTND